MQTVTIHLDLSAQSIKLILPTKNEDLCSVRLLDCMLVWELVTNHLSLQLDRKRAHACACTQNFFCFKQETILNHIHIICIYSATHVYSSPKYNTHIIYNIMQLLT